MILLTSTMPFAAVMAFAVVMIVGVLVMTASDAIKTFRRK